MAIALDSNILLYASGFIRIEADRAKVETARTLIMHLDGQRTVVAAQALGEVHHVLTRFGMSLIDARAEVARARGGGTVIPTLAPTFDAALDLATRHRFQIWDAIIVTTAAEAGARWLLSEDMQDGFVWRGVTILNPFPISLDVVLGRIAA